MIVLEFLCPGEQSGAGAGTSGTQKQKVLTDIDKLQTDYRLILQKKTENKACSIVQSKKFQAHRNVLCTRSTAFEAMLGHDVGEWSSLALTRKALAIS